MNKHKQNKKDLKVKLSIRINPNLSRIINEIEPNKSKYIDYLIYNDLKNKGLVKEMML